MTELRGFRCDNCGLESITNEGRKKDWHEVSRMMITQEGWQKIMSSSGLHYCSQACVLEHSEELEVTNREAP